MPQSDGARLRVRLLASQPTLGSWGWLIAGNPPIDAALLAWVWQPEFSSQRALAGPMQELPRGCQPAQPLILPISPPQSLCQPSRPDRRSAASPAAPTAQHFAPFELHTPRRPLGSQPVGPSTLAAPALSGGPCQRPGSSTTQPHAQLGMGAAVQPTPPASKFLWVSSGEPHAIR